MSIRNSTRHLLLLSSCDELTYVRSSSSRLEKVVLSPVVCFRFLNEREADIPSI
jgi:hypothetical protein